MREIIFNNKKLSGKCTVLVFLLVFLVLVIPLIFHLFFYYSSFYKFIIANFYIIYLGLLFFFYIIYYGIFYYKIKFEYSSFLIQSRRTLSSWFGSKVYNLELSNDMLIGFRFFRNSLSINNELLIQIRSSSGRRSAVRIPLTLLGKKRKRKLEQIFNKIIQNNGCQSS